MVSHYLRRLFDMMQDSHWFSKTTTNCNILPPAGLRFGSWQAASDLCNVSCYCLNNNSFDLSVQSTLFSSSLFIGKLVFLLMFLLDSKVLLMAHPLCNSNLCDVFMNLRVTCRSYDEILWFVCGFFFFFPIKRSVLGLILEYGQDGSWYTYIIFKSISIRTGFMFFSDDTTHLKSKVNIGNNTTTKQPWWSSSDSFPWFWLWRDITAPQGNSRLICMKMLTWAHLKPRSLTWLFNPGGSIPS